MKKDFKDLKVYQLSLELFQNVLKDVDSIPDDRVGNLIADQVLRSVSSISANIAEGYGRMKGREYIHFLYISRGSLTETIDWYLKLKLIGYISEELYLERINLLNRIRALLTGLINSLESKYNNS